MYFGIFTTHLLPDLTSSLLTWLCVLSFFLIYQIQFALPTSSWVCAKSLRACSIYQEPRALRKLNLPLSVVVSCQLLLGLGREGLRTHLFSPPWQLSGVSLRKAHACCPNCCALIIQMSCCVPKTVFLWSPIVSGPYKPVSSSAWSHDHLGGWVWCRCPV